MTETTLFTDEPIIIAGTTDTGRRWVQFWGERKIAGFGSFGCRVEMSDANVGGPLFAINEGCPDEWMDQAWAVFLDFQRDGIMPTPTHTMTWQFSKPDFTPAAPEGNKE